MQTPTRWLIAVLVSLIAVPFPAAASDMQLTEAQALARETDPQLERLAAEIRAAESRAVAAGERPDPKLTLGTANVPVPDFSLSDEPMSQLRLGVSQRFPGRQALDAATSAERTEAQRLRAKAALRRLELDREMRDLWLNLQHERALLDIERRRAETLDELVEVLATHQRSDRAYQTAVLSGSARRVRLERVLADRRAEITRLRAALTERLDPTPLPQRLEPAALEPPEATPRPNHPEIELALQAIARADAGISAARAAFKPSWEAAFGIGQRFGDTPAGAPSETLINATLSIDLPLFTGNRQARRLDAARAEREAAATTPVAVRRNLRARADGARERYADYAAVVEQYGDEVLDCSPTVKTPRQDATATTARRSMPCSKRAWPASTARPS